MIKYLVNVSILIGSVNGNFGEFIKLRKFGANFKFGVSIGGWSFSKHFSEAVRTSEARSAFVYSIITFVNQWKLLVDRIDIDWEHVSPNGEQYGNVGNSTHPQDGPNYALFLEQLRLELDKNGHSIVAITACVAGDPDKMDALPLKSMSKVLETINLMTYDFKSSSWGPTLSGHQSNLYSTSHSPASIEKAVDHCIRAGVPSSKIVIGAVLYSRGFANTNGLGQPSHGNVPDKSWEDGVLDYKDLPTSGAAEYYDNDAKAAYSYDPNRKILNSYDNVQSVGDKCKFVQEHNLAGIIVWESSGDFPGDHPRSLLNALHRGLS